MELLSILSMIVAVAAWLLLLAVRSLVLARPELGEFELRRRAALDDDSAKHQLEKSLALPRLRTVKRLVELALVVLATSLSLVSLGWWGGLLLSLLMVAVIELTAGHGWLSGLVDRYYRSYEPSLLAGVRRAAWVDGFVLTDRSTGPRINSKPELQHLLEVSPGVLTADEARSIVSLLNFSDKTVADIMTPRSVVKTVGADDGVGPLVLDGLHKTGHSRFPVIEGDIDHVVGMLYLHDLINLRSNHESVRQAMRTPVHYIRQDQDLEHALHGFLRTHHHLFIVVNEYRETVGIISLEDVIEAMLGRTIVDEFDEFHDLRQVAARNPNKNNQPKRFKDI